MLYRGDDYKTGGINSNNNTSAREKMRQRRMSESRASSSSTSTSSRPLVGATGLHARKRTQEIAGVATENMGQGKNIFNNTGADYYYLLMNWYYVDAVNRLLKAKLDILQQDLNKMLKEKEVKVRKNMDLEIYFKSFETISISFFIGYQD